MQKINNGDTGAQAADKIYNNDMQAILQWKAEAYPINTMVIYEDSFYKSNAATTASDAPGVSLKWTFVTINSNDFKEVPFSQILDLTRDTYTPYKLIFGGTSFTEGEGSKFGKMAFYKLTGGSLSLGPSFKMQEGSDDYNPALTNIVVFWKEYNLVRYTIENLPYEPVPVDPNTVTVYSFTGTPGTLLSDIPHQGQAASGNITGNAIVSTGNALSAISNTGGFANAFGFNLTGKPNYKVTITGVAINGYLDVILNGATVQDSSKDYFSLGPTRYNHVINGTPTGFVNATINGTVEFSVVGNKATMKVNGSTVLTDKTLLSGNGGFVSFLLGDIRYSQIKSLTIETI